MSKYEISPSVSIKSCSPLHTNHTVRKKPSAVRKVQKKKQIKLMVNFKIIIYLPKKDAVINVGHYAICFSLAGYVVTLW